MNTNDTLFDAATCNPDDDGQHVGARLFAARTAGGHALEDIAANLNIRTDHLRALEEGWWDELPSQAYAIGFLKSYARFLGLNASDIVARYRAENGHLGLDVTPCHALRSQPIEESRIPKAPIVVMSAFLALAGYCGWYFIEGSEYVAADSASAIPAHLAALATSEPASLDEAAAPLTTLETPAREPAPVVQLSAVDVAVDRRIAMVAAPLRTPRERVIARSTAPADTASSEQSQVSGTLARLGAPVLIRPANAGMDVAAEDSRITLRAKTDTWILVEDGKDTAVRQGVLRAGEQYRAPDVEGLTLTTSNLEGLEVLVDGAVKPLRPNGGAIARDLPLDVERLAAL